MLTEQDVQRAVEFESYDAPVLSVYLNVDPRRRTGEQHKASLRNLLAGVEGADPEDVKRVQNYIEMGYNRQGRSVIMFSCAKKDFWWAFSFAVPVEDFAFVSFRPYVRQLARMLDIYERCGVVHVDQEGARLYLFNMGVLENAEGYMGEEVKLHRGGGWANPRIQRHETGQARQNLQEAAELAEEFYRNSGTRRLILAGTDKNVARFKDLLSNRLRSHDHRPDRCRRQRHAERPARPALGPGSQGGSTRGQCHRRRGDRVTACQGGNAVLGLTETLTAVQQGRAATSWYALDDYAQPAYRFVDSGHILLELTKRPIYRAGAYKNLPDAVESCLRRALAQNIGVTVIERARRAGEGGQDRGADAVLSADNSPRDLQANHRSAAPGDVAAVSFSGCRRCLRECRRGVALHIGHGVVRMLPPVPSQWRSTKMITLTAMTPRAIHCAVARWPITQASGRNISTQKRPNG